MLLCCCLRPRGGATTRLHVGNLIFCDFAIWRFRTFGILLFFLLLLLVVFIFIGYDYMSVLFRRRRQPATVAVPESFCDGACPPLLWCQKVSAAAPARHLCGSRKFRRRRQPARHLCGTRGFRRRWQPTTFAMPENFGDGASLPNSMASPLNEPDRETCGSISFFVNKNDV